MVKKYRQYPPPGPSWGRVAELAAVLIILLLVMYVGSR